MQHDGFQALAALVGLAVGSAVAGGLAILFDGNTKYSPILRGAIQIVGPLLVAAAVFLLLPLVLGR